MLLSHDQIRSTAPASCLIHRSHDRIRSTAPTSCLIASDEYCTALSAGGTVFRVPWHWHDCLMIILPSRGTIDFKDEAHRFGTWLSEERFVVVPKSAAHAGDADHTRMIVMYLTDSLIGRFAAQFGSLDRIRRRVRETAFFAVTPEIRSLQYLCFAGDTVDKAVQASRNHIVSALLIQVLAQIERSEPLSSASSRGHGDGVVAAIRSFIEARLAEDLPLNLIADRFGLSRRHTTRLFRRWTGLSIAEYQERQRIRAAHKLLTDTTLPVGEIAWRLGYESGSALARAMRRVTGHSPSAIRGRPEFDGIEAPNGLKRRTINRQ